MLGFRALGRRLWDTFYDRLERFNCFVSDVSRSQSVKLRYPGKEDLVRCRLNLSRFPLTCQHHLPWKKICCRVIHIKSWACWLKNGTESNEEAGIITQLCAFAFDSQGLNLDIRNYPGFHPYVVLRDMIISKKNKTSNQGPKARWLN